MQFRAVYYEPESIAYPLGKMLQQKYAELPWIPIESHNNIEELRQKSNSEFAHMKQFLIVGTRKTHKYAENEKISDYLVPYTSSGCSAACLYCYLVCNYNKCSYLRLFVNREQMFDRLCAFSKKQSEPKTFEIGSNSDLILENKITGNLEWTIPAFAEQGQGFITFPTKFHDVGPLLSLDHRGKTIFRMSVNPEEIIRRVEFGTSPLRERIEALNKMSCAGYPCGILIAPIVMIDGWESMYSELISRLSDEILPETQKKLTVEVIFMTYSYVHRAINHEAFPNAIDLFNPDIMTGRGRGKYRYYGAEKDYAQSMLRTEIEKKLPDTKLLYIC